MRHSEAGKSPHWKSVLGVGGDWVCSTKEGQGFWLGRKPRG